MPAKTARYTSAAASPVTTKPGLKPPEVCRPAKAELAPAIAASGPTQASPPAGDHRGSSGTAASAGAGLGGGAKPPFDWDGIGLGSLVLAQADDEDAYYAAKVVATKADDHFVLTWADYHGYPEFSRPRLALGLLHPATPTRGR